MYSMVTSESHILSNLFIFLVCKFDNQNSFYWDSHVETPIKTPVHSYYTSVLYIYISKDNNILLILFIYL